MAIHRTLLLALSLQFAGYCMLFAPSAAAQNIVTGKNAGKTLQLGKIEVKGEPMVLKVLQMIKQGLMEPYSNDPKLANVVVCRMNLEAGSHISSTLVCATNRVWSEGRDVMHLAGTNAIANETGGICTTEACENVETAQIFAPLNDALNSLPGHYLHASVNRPALQSLLQNIPVHVASTPAPFKTHAPAAGTRF
jgi:hypothetical protein